jgi:histidinol dehydrogenase
VGSVANAAAARRALRRNGAIVLVGGMAEAVATVNSLAPEHAQVMTRDAESVAGRLVAGAVFVGPYSPVAVGDYGIGPNHVLPTGGTARYASPLSVRDFQRRQSCVRMTRSGLRRAAGTVVSVARAEGFRGHAQSILARFA